MRFIIVSTAVVLLLSICIQADSVEETRDVVYHRAPPSRSDSDVEREKISPVASGASTYEFGVEPK